MAKKKKGRNLLILCLIFAVLCGGYAGLRAYNANADSSEDSTDTSETEEETALVELEGDITSLSYTAGDQTLEMVCKDDTWTRKDDASFPLKSSAAAVLVSSLKNAAIYQSFEPTDGDLAQYGLEDPAVTVTLTDDTGASVTLLLGDENVQAAGSYAMVEGSNEVVLTTENLAEDFSSDWYTMAELPDDPGIVQDDIDTIRVEYPETTYDLAHLDSSDDLADPTDSCSLYFVNKDGTYQSMDSDDESNIYTAVTGLTYDSMVDCAPDDAALETYGLKNPAAKITVDYTTEETAESTESSSDADAEADTEDSTDTEETTEAETVTVEVPHTYILTIGAYDEASDSYYVMNGDEPYVYTMSSDTIGELMNIDPAKMINLNATAIKESTVDSIDVTYNGTTSSWAIERPAEDETDADSDSEAADETEDVSDETEEVSEDTADDSEEVSEDTADDSEDTEDDSTSTGNVYTKDGETIDASAFNSLFEAATELEATRVLDSSEVISGEPTITITFHRNWLTNPTVTVKLYQWNDNYYQMAVGDGEPNMAVDIGKIKTLLSAISAE